MFMISIPRPLLLWPAKMRGRWCSHQQPKHPIRCAWITKDTVAKMSGASSPRGSWPLCRPRNIGLCDLTQSPLCFYLAYTRQLKDFSP